MICAGSAAPPIAPRAAAFEICHDYFEPRPGAHQPPAFALHALGLGEGSSSAAFALLPADPSRPSYWFIARWGRQGVGSQAFMPVPAQTEDDRPGIMLYGHKTSNFTWRSCQWEIAEILHPRGLEIPTASGEVVEIPGNADSPWALRDGAPLANLDTLGPGEHAQVGVVIEAEAASYLVHFGGRVWRRWRDPDHHEPLDRPALELLAFDPQSAGLSEQLDAIWSGIGGQEEAKRELVRAIQWPVLYPELFLLFKRRRSRGVLLHGPPGCGKTMLGKAVAQLLAVLYRRRPEDGGFQYVKGHQLLDQYVGNSEKAVKQLFDQARRWREDRGYPAVLFFDEADALFARRPAGGRENGFTLVPALLAEMDGMEESGAFVMLATNRPDALDEAITRPGRIDRRIRITRPDEAASARIFRIHLEGVFLAEGETVETLSARAAAALCAGPLGTVTSGALIQNITDRATANKMEHCITQGVRVGLDLEDLVRAMAEVAEESAAS